MKIFQRSRNFSQRISKEELLLLKETAFKFCKDTINPIASEIDKSQNYNFKPLIQKLGELGFLGVTIPSQYGGSELGFQEHLLITEEIFRSSGSAGLAYLSHSHSLIHAIEAFGSEEQKNVYLPALSKGEIVGSSAPAKEIGKESKSFQLTYTKKQDRYVLNGKTPWFINALSADLFLTFAANQNQKDFTAFLIDTRVNPVKDTQEFKKIGCKGVNSSSVILKNFEISEQSVLGDGMEVMQKLSNSSGAFYSSGLVGIMQAALDCALPYCAERKQFNQPIGNFQLVQSLITDIYTSLLFSRSYVAKVGQDLDLKTSKAQDITACHTYTAREAVKACIKAIQCLGGYGYIQEFPTGRYLRDSKMLEIFGGIERHKFNMIGTAALLDYLEVPEVQNQGRQNKECHAHQ